VPHSPNVYLGILVILIMLLVTLWRIIAIHRRQQREYAKLAPRSRLRTRNTDHDIPAMQVLNGKVSENELVYQEDYEQWDASTHLYKAPPRRPASSTSAQLRTISNAQYNLAHTLQAPPALLIAILHQRAIRLYQEQNGSSWLEARQSIRDLEGTDLEALNASEYQGTDPMVTYFLLMAGYRDDAISYFCWGSGAGLLEATAAIDFFQQQIIN
jgi:hypothetical protein